MLPVCSHKLCLLCFLRWELLHKRKHQTPPSRSPEQVGVEQLVHGPRIATQSFGASEQEPCKARAVLCSSCESSHGRRQQQHLCMSKLP